MSGLPRPGQVVRYHGTHIARHGLYRVLGRCRCRVCTAPVTAPTRLVLADPATGHRLVHVNPTSITVITT